MFLCVPSRTFQRRLFVCFLATFHFRFCGVWKAIWASKVVSKTGTPPGTRSPISGDAAASNGRSGRETSGKLDAVQKKTKLTLDKERAALAGGVDAGPLEEGFEMLADNIVERCFLGFTTAVGGGQRGCGRSGIPFVDDGR